MSEIKNIYDHTPPQSVKPKSLVVLLHGLGSNGQDLISLAPIMSQVLNETVFVSPDAPFPCDMAPFGYQWFSLQDRDPDKVLSGIQTATPVLNIFIAEQLEKYDITPSKCALLGFSQGTMMSLYAGPRYEQPLAGILGYSGALFWEDEISEDSLHKCPVHLIHGEDDNVVPVDAFHAAKAALEHYKFDVTGYTQAGLMHGIDDKAIASGLEFLKKILG